MRRVLALATILAAFSACGSPAAPKNAAAGNDDDTYPTPYTAEEIHLASKVGRRIEMRVEAPGKPPERLVFRFVTSDDEGADVQSEVFTEDGRVIDPPETKHASWDELRHHGAFPKAQVKVHEESVTVPAGTFDCLVYVVDKGGGEIDRFFFAKGHAGPPVFYVIEKDGAPVRTARLLSDVTE